MTPPAKLAVIGLDGADKDLILRWAAKGKLPNFKRAMERATWGVTETPPGLGPGGIWPSFYTGVSPATHGMFDPFALPRRGGYSTRPFTSRDFATEPFWQTLSRAGRRVAVIDAPYTFLSSNLNGLQIVDWAAHAPMPGSRKDFLASEPGLGERIRSIFGHDTIGHCDLLRLATVEDYRNYRDDLLERVRRKTGLNLFLLEGGGWDCFFTVYHESRCIGHRCWHVHDPYHPQHDPEIAGEIGDVIEQVYAVIDEGVGRILDRLGPEANVLLFSSAGMGPHYRASSILDEILLALEGLDARRAPNSLLSALHWPSAGPHTVKRRFQVARTAMAPLLKRRIERDRSKRSCFATGGDETGDGIRLNLIGRERRGRLEPGEAADAFLEQLIKDLSDLTLPGTDARAISRVIRSAEAFKGPRLDDLPDLLIEWNEERPLHGVCSMKLGLTQNKQMPSRTGGHRPGGLFFALGPDYPATRINAAAPLYSFAPAITAILDVEPGGAEGPAPRFLMPVASAGANAA